MCDKQGNSYYVHYNIKEVSDQWAVGLMGCRTNGLSNQWAVGPQGSYRHPVQFSVHDSLRITAAIHRSQHIFSVEIDRMVFFPPLSSTQHAITTKSMLSYNHLCL